MRLQAWSNWHAVRSSESASNSCSMRSGPQRFRQCVHNGCLLQFQRQQPSLAMSQHQVVCSHVQRLTCARMCAPPTS
jgi:hypothetical protein